MLDVGGFGVPIAASKTLNLSTWLQIEVARNQVAGTVRHLCNFFTLFVSFEV